MTSTHEQFSQAANHWDLETLYTDLASAKGKRLTPVEKLHLRGLLCGYSPSEIAEKLGKNPKGVETDLCATLYRYVKSLVDKCNEKIENWRNITEWLDEAGYKTQLGAKMPVSDLLPDKSVVNITNISIENNQIVFLINLRIPTSQASEPSIQNLDLAEDIVKNSSTNGSRE
ncbi:MAG TPA: helix-turn-helix domain containing protein [Cyanobacteria bacterium UBA12227]|nr:helix-turn-helix domain containing protein [Cyanobacteria bacterium UBA12227]HAX85816.1 helix-turn-helix domain containing protein [Cyanobacteria bacterium UBA11370]HBY77080.1 helix-turn-helix domain containing protein [Cyanobacteria bacterium UBA11148]